MTIVGHVCLELRLTTNGLYVIHVPKVPSLPMAIHVQNAPQVLNPTSINPLANHVKLVLLIQLLEVIVCLVQ